MHYLFEHIRFKDKPFLFYPTGRSTSGYPGYYHWHQCCEALYVHEGRGTVIVNQKTYEMRPGVLFFFQPFQLHKVHASVSEESPYVRTVMYFQPHGVAETLRPFRARHALFERLWRGRDDACAIDLRRERNYLERVLQHHDESLRRKQGIEEEEDMILLLLQLLEAIHRSRAENDAIETLPEYREFTYSERAMEWIERHYAEDIGLEALAEALHLSKFYLSRLFQRETGGTISEYIIARRIKQACRLLQTTTYSVQRIAYEVGYPNVSYFIRLFRKVMGTTPLKYRGAERQGR